MAKAPPEQPGSRADADPGAGAWRTGTVLAGVALAVQLVHIAGRAAHDPLYAAPILDAAANLAWARQIAFGGGLEQEVFLRGPAYLYALAAVLRVAGDTVTPVYVLQGVLAALAVGLAAGLAHRVRGIAAGAVAGLLLACNPALLHFTGEALDTVLAGLLLLAGAALLWWARQRAFLLGWTALAGCVLGLAALTRPSILGLLPLAGLWVAVAAGPRPRTRAVAAGVVLLAAALTIAPATLRNRVLGGDWVPITATSGINLYLGNHAGSDGMSANADALGSGWWQDGFRRAAEVAERDQGRSLRPSEVSRHWRLATWRDARARPLDAARHLLWKAYLLLLDEEIPNNKSLGLTLPHSPIGRLPLPGFALLLAGAVAGLAARRGRGPLPSLLWTVVLGHAAITVLFLVNARYRWPMVPCLAVLAGIGWAELLTLVRDGLRRHSAPGGWLRIALPLAAAVTALVVARSSDWLQPQALVARTGTAEEGRSQLILANHFAATGEAARAEGAYRAALASLPLESGAMNNLGVLLWEQGRRGEARRWLEASVSTEPDQVEARFNLGSLLLELGDPAGAVEHLERAAAIDPQDPTVEAALAEARAARDRTPPGQEDLLSTTPSADAPSVP